MALFELKKIFIASTFDKLAARYALVKLIFNEVLYESSHQWVFCDSVFFLQQVSFFYGFAFSMSAQFSYQEFSFFTFPSVCSCHKIYFQIIIGKFQFFLKCVPFFEGFLSNQYIFEFCFPLLRFRTFMQEFLIRFRDQTELNFLWFCYFFTFADLTPKV